MTKNSDLEGNHAQTTIGAWNSLLCILLSVIFFTVSCTPSTNPTTVPRNTTAVSNSVGSMTLRGHNGPATFPQFNYAAVAAKIRIELQ